MTPEVVRKILALYRPGTADEQDPEIAAALQQVQLDPELGRWFAQYCAFQTAMRKKFREIPVPSRLPAALLAQRKVVPLPTWWQQATALWRRPAWVAVAAAIVMLAGLAAWWLTPRVPDRFRHYRARMVQNVLRQYAMDVETNDMLQVRQFMAARGAPSDYILTRGLERLDVAGGGFLRWRNAPVAMVCFHREDQEMLYLFVMKRTAVKDPPPARPRIVKVSKLMTATWSEGQNTYVLAGPAEPGFARKYLSTSQ